MALQALVAAAQAEHQVEGRFLPRAHSANYGNEACRHASNRSAWSCCTATLVRSDLTAREYRAKRSRTNSTVTTARSKKKKRLENCARFLSKFRKARKGIRPSGYCSRTSDVVYLLPCSSRKIGTTAQHEPFPRASISSHEAHTLQNVSIHRSALRHSNLVYAKTP